MYDELQLDTLGDKKTALFLIMSDTDVYKRQGYHTITGGKIHPCRTAEAAPVLCSTETVSYTHLDVYKRQYPNFTAYKFLMYISAIKGLPPKKAHNRTMELLSLIHIWW